MALFLFERRKTVATWTYADGEAKRKDFMVFWITDGSTTNITKDKLEIIGKGVEDMPISMNPETEESQDVLGNNNYDITGYAESMTVDPTNVSGESKYAQKIDTLMEERATLSDLRLKYLCVKRYKTDSTGNMRAWVQEGVVELGDFAGGLKGVSATHTVHYVGDRTLGAVNPKTMTFTADGASLSE
jgi:hypothetical protein|nr:MAG TPA: hypothetical protein [Bacteriophage sp.]